MTTKAEAIAALKKEHPTLRVGDDEMGYTDLSAADYEATIEAWADNVLADEAKAEAALKAETDKATLLAKLGITADEAKLLLS
jgi:hypothetical protein